jgi:mannose-6-phosphate isomerase
MVKDPTFTRIPEMAIALSDKVKAMCGFRPLPEIAQHLKDYPKFRDLGGPPVASEMELMQHSPATQVEPETNHEHVEQIMVTRLYSLDTHDDLQKLILQFQEELPGDCGIFAPPIFNIEKLSKDEALFIDANEPHAYISGEIIDCTWRVRIMW